jgi:Ca-activated chloride channel family protein
MSVQPVVPLLVAAGVAVVLMLVLWIRGWRSKRLAAHVDGALRLLLAVLAVGVALRPVQGHFEPQPLESRSDVLIMIDRTTSMGATDYAGGQHRMDGVAADLVELLQHAAGAQVSVIVIDDEAQVAVPFTTDDAAVASYVRTVGWRSAKTASGSDISVGAELARRSLEQAAAARPDHLRYFVYAGDGEQTVGTPPKSFAGLAELLAGSLVLGYGSASGTTMPVSPGSRELVKIDGVPQKSVVDEQNLKAIADQVGGQYLHRDGGGSLPELVPNEVRSETEFVTTAEYYWIIALAGAPIILILLGRSIHHARTARAELK